MRRIFVGLFVMSLGTVADSASARAQTPNASPRYPYQEALLEGIALTDSQKIKVETIARGYLELMHASQARMSAVPRDSQRVFAQELQDKQANDLRRVLTPTQQKKFDENRKRRTATAPRD